ncbi:uncharacterized protein [Panulirus ornatus]|uniref:uncharacterized protein n=1 Tax=Panulirus ornatus TaxID=150431 RepID=UPI003A8C12E8
MMRLSRGTPFLHPHLLLPFNSLQRPLCRLPHLLFLLFIYSLTSCSNGVTDQTKENKTHPLLGTIPATSFSCAGHAAGYYADPDTSCQVYHMCDTLENKYSYLCPNHTLFNQKFLVCDHWYMVDCSSAPELYDINNHTADEAPDGSDEANTISVSAGGSVVRETFPKATKSSSVEVASKAPRPVSQKPRHPTVTQTTIVQEPRRRFNAPVTQTTIVQEPRRRANAPVTQTTIVQEPRRRANPPVTQPTIVQESRRRANAPVTQPTIVQEPRRHANPPVTHITKDPKRPTSPPATPAKRWLPQSTSGKPQRTPAIQTTSQPVTDPTITQDLLKLPAPTPSQSSSQNIRGRTRSPAGHTKLSAGSNNSQSRKAPGKHSDASKSSVETNNSRGSRPDPQLTMMPGSVARKPGNKFLFTMKADKTPSPNNPVELQGVVFRPLVVRPEAGRQTFRRSSLPSAVTHKPRLPSVFSAEENSKRFTPATLPASRASHSSSREASTPRIPASLRERWVPRASLPSPAFHSASINLSPVLLSSNSIKHHKQEYPTPLTTRSRYYDSYFRLYGKTTPGRLQIQFPSSGGNRDFYIPSPELSLSAKYPPEVDHNSLNETREHRSADDHHHHHSDEEGHMTMLFPPPPETRMEELQLNPHCPRCHPALLQPGKCRPCVIIR